MAPKPLPDQSLLLKLLRYEPDTGKLFWRPRPLEMFSTGGNGQAAVCSTWNGRFAGKEAACKPKPGSRNYAEMRLFGGGFRAHRIIWKMMTDEEPEQIDHINGDRSDNRFANLRAVTNAENQMNCRRRSHNKSGCTGVFWNKLSKKWKAQIGHRGTFHNLGYYDDLEEAIRVRKAAERRLGFHPNHGRASALDSAKVGKAKHE